MITLNQLDNIKRIQGEQDEQRRRGQLRDLFYSQDNVSIQAILRQDLSQLMDSYDISKLQLITLDEFTKTFLQKISLVHKSPMIVKLDPSISEDQQTKFKNLMEEVELRKVLSDAEKRMKLHNTILIGVRYFEKLDKLYLEDTFSVATTNVIGYSGFENEEQTVIRNRYNNREDQEWVVWERDTLYNYKTIEVPKYDFDSEMIISDRYMVDGTGGFDYLPSYYPFVKYQAADQGVGFWGNGMDSLIELVRTLNVLLTILADDTIAETLRVFLLNFIPVGVDGKPGEFKVGMRNPIIAQTPPGEEATAEIISADLYTEEILQFVDALVDQMTAMHGIDNTLTKQIVADISGVAMRVKNEHIMRTWQNDINTMRRYDYQLLKKIIEVNNYHRSDNKIDKDILKGVTLDYQTPNYSVNELEDYTLEKMKWQDGTSSVLLYVMRRNPEMTKEQATKFIQDNMASTNTLLGVGPLPEITGTEFIDIVGGE